MILKEEAEKCNMYYIYTRWLGGTLTNFATIKTSILRLKKLEAMKLDGSYEGMTKKEISKAEKERMKLDNILSGIKDMKKLPGALFVVDPLKEKISVAEANRLGIPIIALVDTNCDPDPIDHVIPGNDDAVKSIQIFASMVASACMEGRTKFETGLRKESNKKVVIGGSDQVKSKDASKAVPADKAADGTGQTGA